ncbi:hypothetical protein AFERRI_530035 [Acidithiobacillus ferrivorans]|uniref:Uncharacterized protein n=1 Tax=Acidithiobacillus ferrivorans TaxID=160808 RepID=A0A060URT1_9PROT|nr:hypothetical protein AFERRI_530035 [Acidithiobacillus ferrivorans]
MEQALCQGGANRLDGWGHVYILQRIQTVPRRNAIIVPKIICYFTVCYVPLLSAQPVDLPAFSLRFRMENAVQVREHVDRLIQVFRFPKGVTMRNFVENEFIRNAKARRQTWS